MDDEVKRRRLKPEKFSELSELSTREQELFQQAVANSRWEKSLPRYPIDPAPTYYPTAEEFLDPLGFIEKIRPEAESFGICKIIPPEGWRFRCAVDMESSKQFSTKKQKIDRLQESVPYDDGKKYTMREYQIMADEFKEKWVQDHPHGLIQEFPDPETELKWGLRTAEEIFGDDQNEEKNDVVTGIYYHGESKEEKEREKLEEEYWKLVDECAEDVTVEYGNDIDVDTYASGFPKEEKSVMKKTNLTPALVKSKVNLGDPSSVEHIKYSGWNLNNIAKWPGSVLKHFDVKLPGINTPWLYVGMLFSTFSWHNEDNYLASINYHHFGAPKQWYGVPGKSAGAFENVVRRFYKQRLLEVPDLLHNMNTMFSPSKLKALNVEVYKITQLPGEFVITFPQAFHSGFSFGYNCGEAVNFATYQWIDFAVLATERYRRLGRLAVLGHDRLLFTLAEHLLNEVPARKQDQELRYIEDPSLKDKDRYAADLVYKELDRVIKEDLVLRPRLYAASVRDVRGVIDIPPNVCKKIDATASDYDDKRVCSVCRHTCFLSAVACNCSQTNISCLRHVSYLCKCPNNNKYLIEWEKSDRLQKILDDVHALRLSLGGGHDGLTPEVDPNMQVAGPFGRVLEPDIPDPLPAFPRPKIIGQPTIPPAGPNIALVPQLPTPMETA